MPTSFYFKVITRYTHLMLNNIAAVLSGLDKRQLKFTKVFDYKETCYKALTILMPTAANPSTYELAQLKRHRPDMNGVDDLHRELELEYHNAMLFASDKVLELSTCKSICSRSPVPLTRHIALRDDEHARFS